MDQCAFRPDRPVSKFVLKAFRHEFKSRPSLDQAGDDLSGLSGVPHWMTQKVADAARKYDDEAE
jgi:hypothetical protein